MRGLVALMLVAAVGAGASREPFAFFSPSVVVSDQERRYLQTGQGVARVLPAPDRQISLFAAVPVDVDADRVVAWVRDISRLNQSSFVPISRRFSDPPRLEDLSELTLDDRDLKDLRSCRRGNCGVKLTAEEIVELQNVIRGAGEAWRAAAEEWFRQRVLLRVQTYLASGHGGLPPLNDRGAPVALGRKFSSLLWQWDFLAGRMPGLVDYLDRYPSVPASDVESFLYWSKDQLGGRPVITVTHVAIVRSACEGCPEVLIAGKQIFATHYTNASLGITALVCDGESQRYLVYLNRSEVDLLGGFWGGVIRHILEHRVKADAPVVLRALRNRLESGEPPR